MDSWLEDPTGQVAAVCEVCGRSWGRDDMLEAYMPSRVVRVDGIAEPFAFTLLTLGWVGPCCAALANEWQP